MLFNPPPACTGSTQAGQANGEARGVVGGDGVWVGEGWGARTSRVWGGAACSWWAYEVVRACLSAFTCISGGVLDTVI